MLTTVPVALKDVSINGVDIQQAMNLMGDNELSVFSMMRSYVNHVPDVLRVIRTPDVDSLKEFAIHVHGIKGASFNICANHVGEMARELEMLAKAKDLEAVEAKLHPFIQTAEKLVADLNDFLERYNADLTPKKGKKPAPDKNVLRTIYEACVNYKTAHLTKSIEELTRYDYESESGSELMNWLVRQSENLEYDLIRERLENLLVS
ncbi:MAG: hypothetical protein LBR61_04340 [Synergistaceae bacterium]|jgi:HPt (histidine-containing phosphotransfer) domain-containing protein|nr:hypothetical protein [Synergistaceae bacterium]